MVVESAVRRFVVSVAKIFDQAKMNGIVELQNLAVSLLILCAMTIAHGGENQTVLDFLVAT